MHVVIVEHQKGGKRYVFDCTKLKKFIKKMIQLFVKRVMENNLVQQYQIQYVLMIKSMKFSNCMALVFR